MAKGKYFHRYKFSASLEQLKKSPSIKNSRATPVRTTHAFSGCLAHVHLTFKVVLDENNEEDLEACGPILEIHGMLEHSENCSELPFGAAPTCLHKSRAETGGTVTSVMTASSDQFELWIASPPMLEAAWHHGHGKLILMDSTFGVSLQKILFFVVLVIDENYKGVPVALFLFSAPTGNLQTSSSYNTSIFPRFFSKWKAASGEKNGECFTSKESLIFNSISNIAQGPL
ncbi:hypothetical protein BDK51DRAFT_29331 [Blyttiomyces helicus]|uniref:Uncharacterized protein n=1 Tax=Blyttiomyces helicus TaxID=388810 RepID=A0A4P9W5P4_9FUNG|nr:hypothetical protein BDK51DRAFT_29331 [Blyttiomyces helicus]|eukprot:RKO87741.1 hypothetical protein BDK51DRAFT_29331 [Blyttiomyces helicus]